MDFAPCPLCRGDDACFRATCRADGNADTGAGGSDATSASTHPAEANGYRPRHRRAAACCRIAGRPAGATGAARPLRRVPGHTARDGLRVTPPRANAAYLSNPPPDYPAAARDHRQEGRVVLRVLVAADGRPQEVSVARGCGFPLLDQAAVVAVQRWRFVPAQRDGAAVDAAVLVPITFKLRT